MTKTSKRDRYGLLTNTSFRDNQGRQDDHNEEDVTEGVEPEGEPAGRGKEQEPGGRVEVLVVVVHLHEPVLRLEGPDGEQPADACWQMRVERAATWTSRSGGATRTARSVNHNAKTTSCSRFSMRD